MSETLKTLIESLLMIGAITAGLTWYGVVVGRREHRETQSSAESPAPWVRPVSNRVTGRAREIQDPDEHLGRCGAE